MIGSLDKDVVCTPLRSEEYLFPPQWLAICCRNRIYCLPDSYHWTRIRLMPMKDYGYSTQICYRRAMNGPAATRMGTLADAKSLLNGLRRDLLLGLTKPGQRIYFFGNSYSDIKFERELYVPRIIRDEKNLFRLGWACISDIVESDDMDFMFSIRPSAATLHVSKTGLN